MRSTRYHLFSKCDEIRKALVNINVNIRYFWVLPKLINIEVTDERMLRGWGNLSFVEILMPDDTDDKNKNLVSETLVSRDLI